MSVKSVLDKIGTDIKDVFAFLGSTKGQALVTSAEGIVETIVPGAAGAVTLFNNWFTEIIKTQAIATAAAAQSGSDTQKAAMVLSAVGPQAVQFAQVNGLSAPTAGQLNTINSLLVQAFNVLSTPSTQVATGTVASSTPVTTTAISSPTTTS